MRVYSTNVIVALEVMRVRTAHMRVPMQPPAGRGSVERLQKVLPGHRPEFVVNLLGRTEFNRERMQPGLPRAGCAAAKVGCHVLHDESGDKIRPRRRQTPAV